MISASFQVDSEGAGVEVLEEVDVEDLEVAVVDQAGASEEEEEDADLEVCPFSTHYVSMSYLVLCVTMVYTCFNAYMNLFLCRGKMICPLFDFAPLLYK